jgi:hypothetical protein
MDMFLHIVHIALGLGNLVHEFASGHDGITPLLATAAAGLFLIFVFRTKERRQVRTAKRKIVKFLSPDSSMTVEQIILYCSFNVDWSIADCALKELVRDGLVEHKMVPFENAAGDHCNVNVFCMAKLVAVSTRSFLPWRKKM